MSEIQSKYSPKEVETKWYSYWLEQGYFSSEPNDKKPYTIVIPPPNVTGVLHMGHMLNNSLQDILIRKARMSGLNACWVPGTDHASIATEAKVVQKLKEQGISKQDISREEFLEHAWEWTHTHGGIILEQLKKLGCSCDWNRTKFTMDEDLSQSVIKVFVDLYNQGKIYKGFRMINWDPEAKTNISDEEVIYKEQNGKLYFLKYKIENEDSYIVVATTRPETIFGDTAVCFHPEDERYTHLKGKNVIVPLVNRTIPVIYDEYIDREFGTGSLKVTPANDINDYELGKKHQLPTIEIFNDDATLNENGMHYKGEDRFIVRKKIAKELESLSLIEKIEDYQNKVGTSERTGAVIEPKLSDQWYLSMSEIAKPALDVVMNEELKFFPTHYKNTYRHWMENITDWNISRQLYWGHRIPAYYYGTGKEDFVVAETPEEALVLARKKSNNSNLELSNLEQDQDCLDTWFSSWLWPISVFNGVMEPENKEISYYYPTNDLVTGPDIIFFWVARMIMAGYYLRDEKPFQNVYFTGIVRDKQGRKMSKSLGNSPDPIELMEQYGADGVRCGLMMSASAGNDLKFDIELCLQGRNFATKLWNAFRLIKGWQTVESESLQHETEAYTWLKHKIQMVLVEVEDCFEKFRISEALLAIYKLIWDDYCAWYLEIIKPEFGKPISEKTLHSTIELLEDLLKMLHPFMPFITEEIWQQITTRTTEEALIITSYPTANAFDRKIIQEFETSQNIVSSIRNFRNEKGISPKEAVSLYTSSHSVLHENLIKKLANVSAIFTKTESTGYRFMVEKTEYVIPVAEENQEASQEKLKEEIAYLEGFLKSVQAKLSNEKFVANAKPEIVEIERRKKADAEEKLMLLNKQIL